MRQRRHRAARSALTVALLVLSTRADGVVIDIGSAEGRPGEIVSIEVLIDTEGEEVAGTQNDIAFEARAPIATGSEGDPLCVVNPTLNKPLSLAFLPSGCTPRNGGRTVPVETCTGIRAFVFSLSNVEPIPDGSMLYTCQVAIDRLATGVFPLRCANAGAANPAGMAVPTECLDGRVIALDVSPPPTLTPTPTPTPIVDDDDSCQIVDPTQSRVAWLLVMPAVALLWLRRRSR